MGNALIEALQGFSPQLTNLADKCLCSAGKTASDDASTSAITTPTKSEADTVDTNTGLGTQILESTFQYQQMARLAVALQFQQTQQANTQTTSGGSDTEAETTQTAGESVQLSFSFDMEVRTEQLATYQSKTSQVADGLEGTQKESYIQMSQSVAMRFEMSLNVSGQLLTGVANGSEDAANSDSDSLDSLINLMNDALKQSDDALNQISELLDGFFGKSSNINGFIHSLLNNITKELLGSGLLTDSSDSTNPTAKSGTTTQTQSQSFSLQLEFSFEYSASATVTVNNQGVQQADPLMFDLDGDGFELTSYKDGAKFDLLGNGQAVSSAFVTGGDAFLAMDRNGNGTIDSGKELFGEQNGAANGYAELAKFDENNDGVINAKDKAFKNLKLFADNGNGKTEAGELISLAGAGITEISLGYTNVNEATSGANRLAQMASYRRADGSSGRAADAILNFIA